MIGPVPDGIGDGRDISHSTDPELNAGLLVKCDRINPVNLLVGISPNLVAGFLPVGGYP